MDCGAVGLFTLNALDVNNILLPVDLDNFANLLAFVVSPDNLVMREKNKARDVTRSKVTSIILNNISLHQTTILTG